MTVLTRAQFMMRLAFWPALILGILFWINPALPDDNQALRVIHILLGCVIVLSLWTIGVAQSRTRGGSLGLAAGLVLVGLALPIVGLWQASWKDAGANTMLINATHLLLALLGIGCAEMAVRRSRWLAKASTLGDLTNAQREEHVAGA
jgi:hypothetical protein